MKLCLNKSIEAHRLNKKTGVPLGGPDVTIPFGAIIDNVTEDGSMERFTYMGDLFRCPHDLLASALDGGIVPRAAAAEATVGGGSTVAAARQAGLIFERVQCDRYALERASVPGGWLVVLGGASITFYPDAAHSWDPR